METFREELQALINKHGIENKVAMPDFILADMICRLIEALGPCMKQTIEWHKYEDKQE